MTDQPPHGYIPADPLDESPPGGFQPREVREEALAAVLAGVPLGDYDQRVIDWLCNLDDPTARTIGSLLWRERLAGRAEALAGAATEGTCWAVWIGGMPGLTSATDEGAVRRIVNELRAQGLTAVAYSCTPVADPPRDVPATEQREDKEQAALEAGGGDA